jgi:CubicO group peptidase (beta-lactamase class C family)
MDGHLTGRAFGAAVAIAAATAGGITPAPADRIDGASLSRCVAVEAAKLDFSGVLSVVQGGAHTTYARGLVAGAGSASIDRDTQFNIGSAAKMFTAVAIAQLIEAGKIGLDDPVGRTVGGLTPEAAAVTVRQLLTHSAGLGNYFTPENLPALAKARSLHDLLPLVATEKPAFPPGSRFSYSDSGFLLLGMLIEHVSGESYGDYLHAHVFTPAGMTSTGLEPASPPVRAVGMTAMPAPGAAPMLMRAGAEAKADSAGGSPPMRLQTGANDSPPPGPLRIAQEAAFRGSSAGGAFSTAGDMEKFFTALENGTLTSDASFRRLVTPQIVAAPADGEQAERDYGFGFGVGQFDHHRWFGHNGGAPGVNAEAAVFPDDQVSVVVLSNRDPPAATRLFRDLRAMLFAPSARQTCAAERRNAPAP